MHTTHLRKVGGSVMLAVPPAFLEQLHLQPGAAVGMAVDGDRLVIEARPRPKYALEDLLAQCDPKAEPSAEDREWIDARPAGSELF
jgi:antitoxin ChpS